MKRITISTASRLLMSVAVLITLVVGPLLGVSFVNAALRATDADLKGESKLGVLAHRTPPVDPIYEGHLDVADCNRIVGWAADASRLNTPITVSVFADSTLITTVLANVSRPDVAAALGDNGLHGFNVPFPPTLQDIHPHSISVRFETTSIELSGGPKTVAPCLTPPEGTGAGVVLDLTFKIDNGAETTTDKFIGLDFDAVERTAGAKNPVVATLTEYRVRQVGLNEPDTSISASPWQPIANIHTSPMAWAERNDFGERYGERRILLQVKTATLTSNIASDTIVLEPKLKEYTVHAASDHTHPLIQYAASQGFTFPRTFFQACSGGHGGSSPSDISSGFAFITGGALPCPPGSSQNGLAPRVDPQCETKFEYELFGGRQLNKFWHIKSVNVSGADPKFHGANSYLVKGHVTAPVDCGDCPSGSHASSEGTCAPNSPDPTVTIGDIVIEGPVEDDFVDTANPWKNAFVRQLQIHPINPTNPPILRPH